MRGALLETLDVQLKAKRLCAEVQDTIEWLSMYAPEYGVTDEIAEEIKSRLERIMHMAKNLTSH